MKIVKIPKRNGTFRTIYIPDAEQKALLRSKVSELEKKAVTACPAGVIHGFTTQRSPVTNANCHIGYSYSLCFDLKDFFETVTPEKLAGKVSVEEMAICIVDGSARQGLPTSPAIANLAASDMDKAILKYKKKNNLDFVYTRYADDLTFSFNDFTVKEILLKQVPIIVNRCGFKINESKTHFQKASKGRRIITGIAVDTAIYSTRKTKRKLRAAVHQKHEPQARGLQEWMKLKLPNPPPDPAKKFNFSIYKKELELLKQVWEISQITLEDLVDKGDDEDLGDDYIITGDPIYMLGMSDWTTGWKTCVSHQHKKEYRWGTQFWTCLRGTRIATCLSDSKLTINGVSRRKMIVRCLVHKLRSGRLIYDRIYPNDTSNITTEKKNFLVSKLRNKGYISVYEDHIVEKVVGHVKNIKVLPYFDNADCQTGTDLVSKKKVKYCKI